ncbi:MAG: hypothetical protein H0U26_04320 [Acidimicrobiia bacterium]|nr:hypothetical protein [Acidimicrobiia bacterium]
MQPTKRRHHGAGLAVLAVLASACGGSEAAPPPAAEQPAEVKTFCAGIEETTTSGGNNAKLAELLADPPPGLEEAAPELISAERSGTPDSNPQAEATLLRWVEVNCHPEAATADGSAEDRRLGPTADATPGGMRLCSAITGPPPPSPSAGAEPEPLVLYGETGRGDPYGGPMLGVVSSSNEGGFAGDGELTPVQVRDTAGVTAPIPVFQGVALDELGTVVAWQEQGLEVGLYGRSWTVDQRDDLVALAEDLELVDGAFRFPPGSPPEGYEEAFVGTRADLSLVFAAGSSYQIQYYGKGDSEGLITISGHLASEQEFEAFQFLTVGLRRERLRGREVLTGNAWTDTGPAVVTWRDPDGLVVRFVGSGTDLETVQRMARDSPDLTRQQWVDLVEASYDCPELE